MKLLAFDTSNQALSLAILEDEHLLAQTTLNIKKNHSITLMPAIDFLMNSLDMKPTDLDRIVAAQGPGSYTGLRIAVVIPVMDARRNNVYAGFYQSGQAVRSEAHLPLAEVLEIAGAADQPVTFVGETAAFAEQIEATLPQAAIQPTLPDAATIGRLGLELPAQSIHDFVPNYLKRVEAEENWLKTHQESSDSYIQRL